MPKKKEQAEEGSIVWVMWALASFFYAFQYILRVLPNIMMAQIQDRFSLDAADFGQYAGVYYIGYAAVHIPIGILLDRKGPRIVMSLCILLSVLGLLPLLYADVWIYPLVGRMLIGIGSSAAILGVFKVIRMAFPEKRFVRMLGFSVAIGLLGAIYGGQPVYFFMRYLGWSQVIEIICIFGLLLAAAVYGIMPPYDPPKRTDDSIWHDIKEVCTNQRVLLICFMGGLMVGPLEGFADAWGVGYLQTVYQFDHFRTASLPSLIFFGMCFGSPLLSYISERTKAYYPMTILSACVMGAIFIFMLGGWGSEAAFTYLFPIVGVFCASQILVIYKASSSVPERYIALTTSLANMIIMTFGYLFHASIGWIMKTTWQGQLSDGGRPVYSAENFTMGLSVIPSTLIIAAIGFSCLYWSDKKQAVKT